MSFLRVGLVGLVVFVGSWVGGAHGMTVIMTSEEDQIARSERICAGKVTRVQGQKLAMSVVTVAAFEVDECIKQL